jgi:hypothetical protein
MVNLEQMRAGQYNPYRRQLANPLLYNPYEMKKIRNGLTVTNPTTEFWKTVQGPPITIDIVRQAQLKNIDLNKLKDLRR